MKAVKRIGLAVLILILLVILFVFGVRGFMMLSARGRIKTIPELTENAKNEPYDAVIVLGAGVYRDGSMSPMLRYRMETTLACYQSGCVKKIYVTGDHRPGEYDEVDIMMQYLIEQGVPQEDIDYDYSGFSTYESMVHASREGGICRAVVVTQKYHLYRAMYIGKTYGMELYGLPAKNWRLSSGTVMRTVREWAACIKDLWYCIRKVPTA